MLYQRMHVKCAKEMVKMQKSIQMPQILQKGCVLQRGNATRIWGWYKKGIKIEISFQNKQYMTETDENGMFEALIACKSGREPFTLEVRSEDGQEVEISEVYVGDVFVCAGQSNMELPISRVRQMFPEEKGLLDVHHYKVEEAPEFGKALKNHRKAKWSVCVGADLEESTALGYFFGKLISQREGVPVGIINISKGGTPIEAWTSPKGLKDYPELLAMKERFADENFRKSFLEEQDKREDAWHENLRKKEKYEKEKNWKKFFMPGEFSEQGLQRFSGLVYLKKKFSVPEHLLGQNAVLKLGTLTDSDETYVNGVFVGETGYCFPPRIYPVNGGVLKPGENEILIRLECRDGKGRITPDKPFGLYFQTGEVIELKGRWEYQVRVVSEPAPSLVFISRKPTCMYQGMVAPCLNMTVKGVIWYQGESNERNPEQYEKLLKGMICDWREHWRQKTLPFIIVQLPACAMDMQGGGAWSVIRIAQWRAAQLPDVGVTVNLDLGEYNDLHPLNKKEVAYRVYLAARSLIYGEQNVWEGPELTGVQKSKEGVELYFDTKDGQTLLLEESKDGLFEICGADGEFYTAQVEVKANKLIVIKREKDEEIYAIRYAWADAPQRGLLKNHQGFLTTPFCVQMKE